MRKGLLAFLIIILVCIGGYFIYNSFAKKEAADDITVEVKKGKFEVKVTTTGELMALNSEEIKGPEGLTSAGIWGDIKISDMVPEGTVVEQGEFIADLDKTNINTKLSDLSNELLRVQSQFTQTQLDTTMEMRKLRDDLINMKFDLEQKQLELDQSKYETPATIRNLQLELDKAKRTSLQSKKNYVLKSRQNEAKMQEIASTLAKQQARYDQMKELESQFTVLAPKGGMVIYKKDWNGKKIKVGSGISSWDPVVATLPDLSRMISKTYVNEVDISKIKVDQQVMVGVDAFPDRKFKGKVTSVANIGEQLPDNDSKVFEVVVLLKEMDTALRPAMTTSNTILTETIMDGLHIPLECLDGNDSGTFVYKETDGKIVKQEVIVSASNDLEACIGAGLKEGETVYLSTPEGSEKFEVVRLKPEQKPKKIPVKDEAKNQKQSEMMDADKQHFSQPRLRGRMPRIRR